MFSSKKKTGFSKFVASIPNWAWLIISLVTALLLWVVISHTKKGGVVFATPPEVLESLIKQASSGLLWDHVSHSLFRVIAGFSLAFVAAIPVSFLMGWYAPFRHVVEPWIQFVRNIRPWPTSP